MDVSAISEMFKNLDFNSYADQIASGVMSSQDANADGIIGTDEAGFAGQFLSQIDTNGDSGVDQAEIATGVSGLKDAIASLFDMAQAMNGDPNPEELQSLLGNFSGFGK